MALHLCAGCNRHVRVTDPACPFCGDTQALATATPVSRATRAALVFGATVLVAGSSVACSSTPTTSDAGAEAGSDATPAPLYGGPPVDAATDSAPVPPYGLPPPPDAGADVGPVPPYGLPPPLDAGRD